MLSNFILEKNKLYFQPEEERGVGVARQVDMFRYGCGRIG